MCKLISIIMPCYNSANTISFSLESILSQTYKNWELIVIDDCSNDGSNEIVTEYQLLDKRIKLIKLNQNKGVAQARNIGLDNAKGDYVAFLDSDDYWHAEKLEKQISYFSKYNVDVVFSQYYRFNSSGIIGKVEVPKKTINFSVLLKGNCIGNLTGMYDFNKHSDIRQLSIGAEDYFFWLKIFSKPNVNGIGIPEFLAYYRVADHGNSLSGNKFKSAKWTWDIYYRHLNFSLLKSFYYFTIYIYKALKNRI